MLNRFRGMDGDCRDIVFLILGTTFLYFAIETGALGSVDTARRLIAAQQFWSDTTLPAWEDPDHFYTLRGKDGSLQYWWGLGQSLLMLPFDVLAVGTVRLIGFAVALPENVEGRLRVFFVDIFTFLPLTIVTALAGYALCRELELPHKYAISSVILFFLATRLLNATQVHLETSIFILVLLISGFSFVKWAREAKKRWLFIAGISFGFAIITKLTMLFDLLVMSVMCFFLTYFLRKGEFTKTLKKRTTQILVAFVPPVLSGIVIDRLYHFWRFGEFRGTYIDLLAQKVRQTNLEVGLEFPFSEPDWPWSHPFLEGVTLKLFGSTYGFIYFDFIIIVGIYLFIVYFRYITVELKALFLAFIGIFTSYTIFYASYFSPGGMTGWGDRFSQSPSVLLSFISIIMAFYLWDHLRALEKYIAICVFVLSSIVQLASTVFSVNLELVERELNPGGLTDFVVIARFINIFELFTAIDVGPEGFARINHFLTGIPGNLLPESFMPLFIAGWIVLLVLSLAILGYCGVATLRRSDATSN